MTVVLSLGCQFALLAENSYQSHWGSHLRPTGSDQPPALRRRDLPRGV